MIPPSAVALALADTWLARPATVPDLIDAARWACGRDWPWIAPLCVAIHARAGDHFHHYRRDELAALVLENPLFHAALVAEGGPPRILRYCLDLPLRPEPDAWLRALAMPALPTVADLAQWLGATVPELGWFADRWRVDPQAQSALLHYRYRWVAKRSGGLRLIEMPKQRLRAMQKTVLRGLLDRLPMHPAAHGFRRAHSCLTHAALHSGKRVVVRMDLKDFFPSIPASRVHALFEKLGYSRSVAGTLARLCVNRVPSGWLRDDLPWAERRMLGTPHLPQGSPCSPALANACAYRLDMRLDALAQSLGATYSRYADDLAFSGGRELERALGRFHARVGAIALEEGFKLHPRKTRMMRAGVRQQLTGIVVNRHPNIARPDFDRLKAILCNCARHGPAAQNREQHPDFRAHLAGRVAHVAMLNPARGLKLRALFEAIAWP